MNYLAAYSLAGACIATGLSLGVLALALRPRKPKPSAPKLRAPEAIRINGKPLKIR